MLGYKNKEIFCYDENIQLCGVIDNYTSFVFERSYSGIGEWQLVLSGFTKNVEYIKRATYIKSGEGIAGYITKYSEENQDGENNIVVNGIELKGLIQKRIIMPPDEESHLKYTSKSPEYVIANIINTQLINSNANRHIDGIIAPFVESETKITYKGRFSNAAEDIVELASAHQIGWFADIEDNQIIWHIYHGYNRTLSQSEKNRLIISKDYDTMSGTTLEYSLHTVNTALVAGQGEGADRSTVLINNSNSGLNRTETYIDARDIQDSELLPQRGFEKLAEYGTNSTFEIIPNGYLLNGYRQNYDLGDIGTYKEQNMDLRLTAITEVYEDSQFSLQFAFGYDKATLSALLQRIETRTDALLASESTGGGSIPVPISQGGTGATDASTARSNLGIQTAVDIANLLYPIGSIYMETTGVDPSITFGFGSWIAWGSGKVPVGVSSEDDEFNTVEKTGGEKTHTLIESELPAHRHAPANRDTGTAPYKNFFTTNLDTGSDPVARTKHATSSSSSAKYVMSSTNVADINQSEFTAYVGEDVAHNNLQPYITCYMWKRIN